VVQTGRGDAGDMWDEMDKVVAEVEGEEREGRFHPYRVRRRRILLYTTSALMSNLREGRYCAAPLASALYLTHLWASSGIDR